jgi:hypothetical protein
MPSDIKDVAVLIASGFLACIGQDLYGAVKQHIRKRRD